MVIEFYTVDASPYCRGVWMTLEELGLDYDKKDLDFVKGEHKTDEFGKISPNHTIPGLKDGDLAISESKAIACYLCNAYGRKMGKAELYPESPTERARVDMALYLSDSINRTILLDYINILGVFHKGELLVTEALEKVHESLALTEKLLTSNRYIASDHLTIADYFAYISVGLLSLVDFNDFGKYPKITEWMKLMGQLPYHKKTCEEPLKHMREFYQKKLKENSS